MNSQARIRRTSALERREAQLARYKQGDFTPLPVPSSGVDAVLADDKIAKATEEITNLKRKLGLFND